MVSETPQIEIEQGDKIGICPKHGVIVQETVAMEFPVSATCNRCGKELEKATVAPEATSVASA